MHSNTAVMLLQNGIGMEEALARFIPAKQIIGGSIKIKVTKIAPGIIHHFGFNELDLSQYYQNEKHAAVSALVDVLCKDFNSAGIATTALAHLPSMRWSKLVSNIPLSGLSVVLNASIQEMVSHPNSYALLLALTQEVIQTARQCNALLPDDYYIRRINLLEKFKTMAKTNPSMKDDFDAKRPLELQAIYQNALDIARAHHVAMPLTEMLYQKLVYLNDKNLNAIG